MTIALLAYALASVVLGTALGLASGAGRRLLGVVRAFALSAALTVVIGWLLPEAEASLGAAALLVFALGLLLPAAVERLGGAHPHGHDHGEPAIRDGGAPPRHGRIAVELGYAGLLTHQLVEGLGMSSAALHRGAAGVALALAAHTVPLIAVVVMGFADRSGRRTAIARGAGLGAATAAGIAAGAMAGSAHLAALAPWISAAVAGLLLHVFIHDLRADLPRSPLVQGLEIAALVAGAALTLLAMGAFHAAPPAGAEGDPLHHPAPLSAGAVAAVIAGLLRNPWLIGLGARPSAKADGARAKAAPEGRGEPGQAKGASPESAAAPFRRSARRGP